MSSSILTVQQTSEHVPVREDSSNDFNRELKKLLQDIMPVLPDLTSSLDREEVKATEYGHYAFCDVYRRRLTDDSTLISFRGKAVAIRRVRQPFREDIEWVKASSAL